MKEKFKKILDEIPHSPGVYKYFDKNNVVIYVGKAKDLKKRVGSYFSKNFSTFEKTYLLVNEIENIEYILTNSEYEAFLLEMKLINEYKPKYNVIMRDDKSYPYLKVTDGEDYPGIYYVRRDEIDGKNFYVGPFIPSSSGRKVMEIVVNNFGIRTCKLDLSKKKREKPCLKYHLKKCLAPCVKEIISKEKYKREVEKAILFLKKDYKTLLTEIEKEIKKTIKNQNFERGIELREQLKAIKKLSQKQSIFTEILGKNLFVSFKDMELFLGIGIIYLEDGIFKDFEFSYVEKKVDDEIDTILNEVISTFIISKIKALDTIYISEKVDVALLKTVLEHRFKNKISVKFSTNGTKKMVLNLAAKNIKEKMGRISFNTLMNELKEKLNLKKVPELIEAIDISNMGNKYVVGTVICYRNGTFLKKRYRRYRIKSFRGQNDFMAISEIINRRYKKISKKSFPQLLIIDGGKGQLQYALKTLKELKIEKEIEVISIAKREEIIFNTQGKEFRFEKNSPILRFIQMVRNEVHRFSINYQRILRDRDFLKLTLTDIPTIGEKKAKRILSKYQNLNDLYSAPESDLMKLIGEKSCENLKKFIKKELVE